MLGHKKAEITKWTELILMEITFNKSRFYWDIWSVLASPLSPCQSHLANMAKNQPLLACKSFKETSHLLHHSLLLLFITYTDTVPTERWAVNHTWVVIFENYFKSTVRTMWPDNMFNLHCCCLESEHPGWYKPEPTENTGNCWGISKARKTNHNRFQL